MEELGLEPGQSGVVTCALHDCVIKRCDGKCLVARSPGAKSPDFGIYPFPWCKYSHYANFKLPVGGPCAVKMGGVGSWKAHAQFQPTAVSVPSIPRDHRVWHKIMFNFPISSSPPPYIHSQFGSTCIF